MPETFTAATWNVFHGTPPAELDATLRVAISRGVSIFLIQEASAPGIKDVFNARGLSTFRHDPQWMIAYDADAWMARRTWGVRLSETAYYAKGTRHEVHSDAAVAILCDEDGRTLMAMSYHTPAGVQVEHDPQGRRRVLRESARSWRTIAKAAETRACLFGGDDNVDEDGPFGPWGFLRRGPRLVPAPSGTHGNRRIDDFRVTGLKPGSGWVLDTPSDHRLHAHDFSWS